jgi:hypothetical protein
MGRFRALLVGVAEYDDPRVKPLPFVTDGLGAVGAALESRGYVLGTHDLAGSGRLTRIDMLTRVKEFLEGAARGDTLLVLLSGHGAHSDDVDYLVPSDANLGWPRLADVFVPLNAWAPFVENTPASSVVFLVDACREGFDEQVMSGLGRAGWSQGKGLDVANRKVAYVFACEPGARSRFVSGDEEFSLFARAVQQVTADPEGPSTLAEFRVALEQAITQLARDHRKPAQQVRVLTECDQDQFVVLPPGQRAADRGVWRRLAADHPAWDCAGSRDQYAAMHALTEALVGQLTVARQQAGAAAPEDPWQDRGLARRITGYVEFLLTQLLGRPKLSPAEAALLVAAPMVYETQLATQAARLRTVSPTDFTVRPGSDADRASFERFAQGYPRLLRRAAGQAEPTESSVQIGWWLFHRWLARRPESYAPEGLAALLAPGLSAAPLAQEVFARDRMSELMRCFGADPGFLLRTDRPSALRNRRTAAPGTRAEQVVRERFIGYLLATAHYLAIEATRLPEIIADHLGIADPVAPADVYATIDEARWEPRGRSRVLVAQCSHMSVEVALRRHVRDLDELLGNAHDLAAEETDLAPLSALPLHATAELVGAAPTGDGLAYTSAGVRFRLAEDRIQELLMGEQLYGDRALAIRELYQNALDACRYRGARSEYLQRTNVQLPAWQGKIRFEQGTDEHGRPYVDCTDNGIGMGIRELSDVYARAGTRFADLPEFLEEQAEWTKLDPPIRMYPNSRFGIGVLSYFMLADEITITTCRLGRDGLPARLLQVSIAGPGNLFRIRDLGPGPDAGTTIRLHLRPDQDAPSCVNLLSEVLRVAQFDSVAIAGDASQSWRAGELASFELDIDSDPWDDSDPYDELLTYVPAPPVWWCDSEGVILSDGIVTDRTIFGAIVNLTGDLMPVLSVDRRKIIDYRPAEVERLLAAAVPELLAAEADVTASRETRRQPKDRGPQKRSIVSLNWLCDLAAETPAIADMITQSAISEGRAWQVGDITLDASVVGCFQSDLHLLNQPGEVSSRINRASGVDFSRHSVPDWMAAWRATAFGLSLDTTVPISGDSAKVVPALPSDPFLLMTYGNYESSWLDPDEPVRFGHLLSAAVRLGRSPALVADRLAVLGFTVPDISRWPAELTDDDATLLSRGLNGAGPWLDPDEEVSVGHLLSATVKLGCGLAETMERLSCLGFTVPDASRLPADLTPDDATLLSWNLDGTGPWLDSSDPVLHSHLIGAAVRLRRSPAQVAARLAVLGFTVPDVSRLSTELAGEDFRLISWNLDATALWRGPGDPVLLGYVVGAAVRSRRSPAQVADRLAVLGFTVPDVSGLPAEFTRDDAILISWDLDGVSPWLDPGEQVSLGHLLSAKAKLGGSVAQAVERLSYLGFIVPNVPKLSVDLTDDDLTLMSRDLDGSGSWLDPDAPVPFGHVIGAAATLERSPAWVADRLAALGFTVPDFLSWRADISSGDVTLLIQDLDGTGSLLNPRVPLSVGRLIGAAIRLARSPAWVAERLAALGFTVPDVSGLPADFTRDDARLISRDFNGAGPWLDLGGPVSFGRLISASVSLRRSRTWVAQRLAVLGFAVPDTASLSADSTRDDARLISRGLDGTDSWLDPGEPVPLHHLVSAAITLGRSLTETAERLSYLGYAGPDLAGLLPRLRPGSPQAQ